MGITDGMPEADVVRKHSFAMSAPRRPSSAPLRDETSVSPNSLRDRQCRLEVYAEKLKQRSNEKPKPPRRQLDELLLPSTSSAAITVEEIRMVPSKSLAGRPMGRKRRGRKSGPHRKSSRIMKIVTDHPRKSMMEISDRSSSESPEIGEIRLSFTPILNERADRNAVVDDEEEQEPAVLDDVKSEESADENSDDDAATAQTLNVVDDAQDQLPQPVVLDRCAVVDAVDAVATAPPTTSSNSTPHQISAKAQNTDDLLKDMKLLRQQRDELQEQLRQQMQRQIQRETISSGMNSLLDSAAGSSRAKQTNSESSRTSTVPQQLLPQQQQQQQQRQQQQQQLQQQAHHSRNYSTANDTRRTNTNSEQSAVRHILQRLTADNAKVEAEILAEKTVHAQLAQRYKDIQKEHQRNLVSRHAILIHTNNKLSSIQHSILRLNDSGLIGESSRQANRSSNPPVANGSAALSMASRPGSHNDGQLLTAQRRTDRETVASPTSTNGSIINTHSV